MTRYYTYPRKCRRGHLFIKDKSLLWNSNTQHWTIIKNCKYCIDARRIANQIEAELKVSKEERLLREIFEEGRHSRFHKVTT